MALTMTKSSGGPWPLCLQSGSIGIRSVSGLLRGKDLEILCCQPRTLDAKTDKDNLIALRRSGVGRFTGRSLRAIAAVPAPCGSKSWLFSDEL